jgi:TPP-dependent pyruvate/acetoin dehydrogenase alpha subunit
MSKRTGQAGGDKNAAIVKPKAMDAQNNSQSSSSNPEFLRRLYSSVLKCQGIAEQNRKMDLEPSASRCHFAQGDEAIIAGATLDLQPQDTIVACCHPSVLQTSRGTCLVAGPHENGNLASVAPGKASAYLDFADAFTLGTGIALAQQLEKTAKVVIALGADHASSADRWHEAMQFAGTHKLPVIYVLRSSSAFETGTSATTSLIEEISFMAAGCGFPAVIVDGHDAVAIWRVSQEAILRARNRGGPTLIVCEMRLTQYETPLAHLGHYMRKRGVRDEQGASRQ